MVVVVVVVVVGVSGECGNKTTSAPSWGWGWAGAELGKNVFLAGGEVASSLNPCLVGTDGPKMDC